MPTCWPAANRRSEPAATWNVGTGTRVTLLELVALAEEVSGEKIEVRHVPERAGDVRDSQASLARAGEVLDYRPRVSIREGMKQLWSWYTANPSAVTARE